MSSETVWSLLIITLLTINFILVHNHLDRLMARIKELENKKT